MSVSAFSNTIKSQIYKTWLKQIEKNIVTNTVKDLRASQQTAVKTDFYIDSKQVQEMYKTVTGNKLSGFEADLFIRELAKPSPTKDKSKSVVGVMTSSGDKRAVMFKSIGFDTISTKLVKLFDSYPEVQDAYKHAEEDFIRHEKEALNRTSPLRGAAKQKLLDEIEVEGKRRGSFGFYFNKGHVISLATNLSKNFRDEILRADVLAKEQRDILVQVLDQYIDKLQKEDLASANLPSEVVHDLYAGYVKSSDKYLVEIQSSVANQASGNLSIAQVSELRKIFSISDSDTAEILNKSPSLGVALLTTEGSPSFIDLLTKDLAHTIATGKKMKPVTYRQAPKKVAGTKTKIVRPPSNTGNIKKAKALLTKIKAVRSDPNKFKADNKTIESTVNLESILRSRINEQVRQNMGSGNETRILNYRTGRFAESVSIERISESRQGMISVFYNYMKNPYATFSDGGRQQYPKTRDPKTLISKSIREIAGPMVANRLRSVVV